MDEFYLTLPSNSSMDYFPNNTRAEFKTRLPREIILTGTWVCGLSDIMFPSELALPAQSIQIDRLQHKMTIEKYNPHVIKRFKTEERHYKCIADLIYQINTQIPDLEKDKVRFISDKDDFVSIRLGPGRGVTLDSKLKAMLGFRDNTTFNDFNNTGTQSKIIYAAEKSYMYHIYTMFIYSNIIQPNIVGDMFAPLLDIIPVQDGQRRMQSYRMEKPRYQRIAHKSILTPEIQLYTDEGIPVPFTEGRTVVKLHFKKIEHY